MDADTIQERLHNLELQDRSAYTAYDGGSELCLDGHYTVEELKQIIAIVESEQ